jgi:hypothetical protein
MHRLGWIVVVPLLTLAACSDLDSPSSASTSPATSSAVRRTSANAQLSFVGDTGLTGAATHGSVRCRFPNLDGPSIALLAATPDETAQFRVAITVNKVSVHVSSGSGTDYHERAFEGASVTAFDAGTGAQVDSPLAELPSPGTTPGAVGAVTSVKASVDCAGQDPGSSTITVTGTTAEGTVNAATLDSARVECNLPGDEVIVLGILSVGSTTAFVEYGLRPDGVDVQETLRSAGQHRYHAPPGSATLTANGGHVNGDALEQDATPPHTLHLEGDAVCGTPADAGGG